MNNPWTDDIVSTLRVLRKQKGLSASQCARALNATYQTHFTRNAVIGKLIRSGIDTPAPMGSKVQRERSHKAAKETARKNRTRWGKPPVQKPIKVFAEPVAMTPKYPAATIIEAVLNLGRDQCKFPIGDPKDEGFGFCGRDKTHGSYCKEHGSVCYVPVLKRRAA